MFLFFYAYTTPDAYDAGSASGAGSGGAGGAGYGAAGAGGAGSGAAGAGASSSSFFACPNASLIDSFNTVIDSFNSTGIKLSSSFTNF